MTYATCGTTCDLTGMGTIAASTAANNYVVYAGIGFKLNQAMGTDTAVSLLTPTGSGITVSFTGTLGAGVSLRAEISDGTTRWCHNLGSSPTTIPYGSFNTKCYDSPPDGSVYSKQPINELQFLVIGGPVAATYSVWLTGVVENQ
jgi:hypothetical protein